MSPRDAVRVLQQSGYVHIPKWYPDATTIYVASSLGKVVDIGALLPRSSIHYRPSVAAYSKKRILN